MTLDEAKAVLSTCTREELRDHAFGDCEVYWIREGAPALVDGDEVASGYFGSDERIVSVSDGLFHETFRGDDADALRSCGTRGRVERNDSTGPDEYHEGDCLPGLTSEGVLDELTDYYDDEDES